MVLVELPQKQWSDLIASYHEEHGVGRLCGKFIHLVKAATAKLIHYYYFPLQISNLWNEVFVLRLCKYPVFFVKLSPDQF